MITGVVTASREAVVQVMVHGAHSRDVPVDAVIDTGFTGFLTLPPPLITMLGLAFAGTTRATLGDGSARGCAGRHGHALRIPPSP